MEAENTLAAWENLVAKQLKTADIFSVLRKENLEGIEVKPYYNSPQKPIGSLPKVEESTRLVAPFFPDHQENIYAFLIDKNAAGLQDKSLFINTKNITKSILEDDKNSYFSLIDIFDEQHHTADSAFARTLLNSGFTRKICVDISLHQNAGASVIQQLACAIAKAKELAELYGKEILRTLIFRMAIGSNYFFEIAKIRALKVLYNQLTKEFGFDEIPYIFAETSLRNKAKNDEENNLIRSTFELAAAMIGGADAVFSNDFKVDQHSELSEEISFKQQIVLAYESIVNVFDDAANGSFYVEEITRQFAENSWKLFLKIEENGGYLASLKSNFIQNEIRDHAILEQKWVEEGKIKLIGVNLYPKLEQKKTAEELYPKGEIKAVRLAEMFE